MEWPEVIIGLDLAQANDWTALAVLDRRHELHGQPYDLIDLQRWRNVAYTATPDRVRPVVAAVRQAAVARYFEATGTALRLSDPAVSLVVDATGVGAAVVDLLSEAALDADLVPVVIHGGDTVNRADNGGYRVPKRDLVSVLQVLLQQRRLRIAEALPEASALAQEMASFRVTITAGGHDRYGAGVGDLAWRERPHDDAVLAVALAAWYAERRDGRAGQIDPRVHAAFAAGGWPGW